jgi:hypothetical protein
MLYEQAARNCGLPPTPVGRHSALMDGCHWPAPADAAPIVGAMLNLRTDAVQHRAENSVIHSRTGFFSWHAICNDYLAAAQWRAAAPDITAVANGGRYRHGQRRPLLISPSGRTPFFLAIWREARFPDRSTAWTALSGKPDTSPPCFFYFDLGFMVWYLLGPAGTVPAHCTCPQQRGLMVAADSGRAILRLLMGVLVDRIGARAGIIGQLIVIAALLGAWQIGIASLGGALLLGCSWAWPGPRLRSSLPLARAGIRRSIEHGAWALPGRELRHRAGALFAPALALAFGWQNVFGLACIPLGAALAIFTCCAKDTLRHRPRSWPTIWPC